MRRWFRSFHVLQVVAVASAVIFLTTCNDEPATVSGPTPVPQPSQPSLATTDAPPMLVAAGNIARCDRTNDEATATLLDGITGTVISLGDAIYGDGSQADFDACYRPSWGRHKDRTRATPGDEEYETPGGAGYFSYFGAAAGESPDGYYSFNLGTWHIVALNSNLSTSATSAQVAWLKADLATTTQPCVLAYWHHPRFSSYGTAVRSAVKPLWDALYEAQADVVLNAHYRLYERFAPQTPAEVADPARGIRQFTVGTGGQGFHAVATVRPNSEFRRDNVYGVLKLTLDGASYAWEYVATTGPLDTGIGTCHGRPGSPPPPNQAPIANAGGPYQSEGTVTFDGSASRDPDGDLPLAYLWDFGGGATATGVAPSRTYSQAGTYPVSLTVTDAEGLAGTPASTTVTIGNLPPSVSAGADATVPHGTAFALDASFGDPGGQGDSPWGWTITWGDGASESGSASALGGPIARNHTYASLGTYTVRVTVTDKDAGSATDELFVTVFDPNAEAVLVGAGDIAACWQNRDEMTAALIDDIPGTVILLGDNAYGQGTAAEYTNCYDPTWGRHKARTKPSPGNHEYGSNGAPGYFGYFGAVAGDPSKGWYSYDAGSWHIIVLNSGKEDFYEAAPGSPQNAWLRADLEANRTQCTLAYWHHPMFTSSSGRTTNNDVRPFWDLLYEFGVDVILNGHDHSYERFAPIRPDGTLDSQFGILAITAGTGGESLYAFGTIDPRSVIRNNVAHGVIKMTLRPGSYEWEFIPIPGQTFTDRGTGTCHGAPGGNPPPNQAPTANHGGPYQADQSVSFNGSGSDPDGNLPLSFAWTFHDGSTSDIANATKTYAADGSYSATLVVTDALNRASAPAVTTVTIDNVAPTVNAGSDATREVGAVYALSASFTDPGGSADAPWSYTIAWGDGTTTPVNGSATTTTSPITASHVYETAGQYTATVTVTDKDGGSGADNLIVTVTAPTPNQAPIANAGGPYTADNTVTFSGTGNDPDGNVPLTYRWTFHDLSTSDVANTTRSYATDGTYSATLVVTDARGLQSAPAEATITITNVAPSVNAGADRSANAGSAVPFSASFTDPGGSLDGPWSWFIAWGDGTRTPATGTASTSTSPITSSHTYNATGEYDVVVTVIDKDGGAASDVVRVTVTPAPASNVLVGAGNIARCDGTNDNATGALLAGLPGATVFTTGDNIHATATLDDYQACYGPAWGGALARTRPTPGDDDYKVAGAAGYFSYFGAAAGDPAKGYYSYDLGSWHIVVLNSNVAMTSTSPQVQWLTQDLAQTTKACVLAYWHHPRFSSYGTGVRPEVKPLWDVLYAARADVVLNGHYRLYERFAPQTPTEAPDPALGIRQFTVGTGGHGTNVAGTPRPNSQFRSPSGTYGVLKLTLAADSYSWEFVAVPGQSVSDTGTTACHPAAP